MDIVSDQSEPRNSRTCFRMSCAVFLTSGEDRRAHDIFRVYRTAFEELNAGFHDLVIFGQHGMSSTCTALIPGLGLTGLQTPSLVLISGNDGLVLHTTGLPAGALAEGQSEEDGDEVPWRSALEAIKQSVGNASNLAMDGVVGLEREVVPGGNLAEAVGRVKVQVEGV